MSLRIAYAGIIQLIARFSTLITGLVFVTIVTRNLPTEDFGLWQVLGSSVALLLIPLAPLEYWTFRYASRGKNVEKTALIAALISIPFMVIVEFNNPSSFNLNSISSLIYLGLFPTAIAFVLRFHIISKAGPIFLSYVAYLIPAFAIFWGYIFLKETVTLNAFIGVIFILFGVFISQKFNVQNS